MKTKSNRRGRRQRGYRGLLWVLAAGLLLFGLIAQQNILLGTSSRHALLMDARTGQVLARKRSGEEAAPASLTKMMTVLLVTEARHRLRSKAIPEAFRGLPITLVYIGVLALAIYGFTGHSVIL